MSNLREAAQKLVTAWDADDDLGVSLALVDVTKALAQPDDTVPVIKAEMYLALTDAMGYQEERDGSNWSPEEWAGHLYESYQSKQDDKTQPVAWLTPELDRVVTEKTMAGARKDGGAILSSLRGHTVPAYATPQPPAEQGEELSDEQIDDYLNQPVPGGSIVRDWFSFPRGLQNVRNVVRIIVTADRAARGRSS